MIYKICKYIYLKLKYLNKNVKIKSFDISVNVQVGKNVVIGKECKIASGCSIGDNSYINYNTVIDSDVQIGKFCSIAPNVWIAPGNHPLNYVTTHPILYDKIWQKKLKLNISPKTNKNEKEKTIIGNDVWIGIKSIILPGVKIGDGAIIGAGSIVTKDVEPYSVVAGNPAKIIKYRFEKEKIKKIMQVENPWWDNTINIEEMYDIDEYLKNNH